VTDESFSGGPLDIATLEVLAQRAESHPLVDGWRFQPDQMSPRHLELTLAEEQYPGPVEPARLDVRWYESGDYSVHYLETRTDDRWQCRWDRHPKPDAPRAHVNPPPDANSVGEAAGFQDGHHLAVLFGILDWLTERIETLYDDR
jgi:hypothetical protein